MPDGLQATTKQIAALAAILCAPLKKTQGTRLVAHDGDVCLGQGRQLAGIVLAAAGRQAHDLLNGLRGPAAGGGTRRG